MNNDKVYVVYDKRVVFLSKDVLGTSTGYTMRIGSFYYDVSDINNNYTVNDREGLVSKFKEYCRLNQITEESSGSCLASILKFCNSESCNSKDFYHGLYNSRLNTYIKVDIKKIPYIENTRPVKAFCKEEDALAFIGDNRALDYWTLTITNV